MKNFVTTPVLLALIVGGFLGMTVGGQNTEKNVEDHAEMNMGAGMDMEAKMSMDDMMASMMQNLDGKTGDELDEAFLRDMVPHHQGAVKMAKILLEGTEREEMKVFANDVINAQSGEIDMMKQWITDWFGTNS